MPDSLNDILTRALRPSVNARDYHAQHTREQQHADSHPEIAKRLAEDWAEFKNRLAAYLKLKSGAYAPDPTDLACIEEADNAVLMIVETKEEIDNCDIDS